MIIEFCSELYPERLKEINNPPSRLYLIGNEKILNKNSISVVGSRTNTNYGERMCKIFTKGLVEYDINIVSGLANGIDSIAHETCIKNGGKTIAVLPSGFNYIYPEKHKELAREILRNGGALLSEYEPNTKPDSKKFLERNRIIAGLSIGTLIIEAGYRSGTSVTAKYAEKYGRNVFCVPSSLDNIKGKTTNELIKKGCMLVTNAEDIVKQYKNIKFYKRELDYNKNLINVPSELIDIYNVINEIPKDINEVKRITGKGINEINYKIMVLEIEGLIQELPGQKYIRKIE